MRFPFDRHFHYDCQNSDLQFITTIKTGNLFQYRMYMFLQEDATVAVSTCQILFTIKPCTSIRSLKTHLYPTKYSFVYLILSI